MTSIIMLTYNLLEYTKLCIKSINENTKNYELIIIDNGSTDGTMKWLKENIQKDNNKLIHHIYDELICLTYGKLIFNKENRGFPAANNQGVEIAKGDYICIMNNDVIVTPHWLDRLIAHLNGQTPVQAGMSVLPNRFDIVGPCTNYVMGKQKVLLDIYNNEDELNAISEKFYQENKNKYESVNWIIGYCMLIKKDIIDKIGLFDERYGLGYCEDIDFCMSAKKDGYKIGIAKDIYVHHFGSKTWLGQKELNYIETINRSKKKFMEKWGQEEILQ